MINIIALALILWTIPNNDVVKERAMVLARQLRCLVCQNQTLADSQADLAVDLRNQISSMIKSGKTDDEIVSFFVERYGDFVLYRPPFKPTTYLLWLAPFFTLLTGGWQLYRRIRLINGEQR